MVIKIFTKRKPGGEPMNTGLEWVDTRIEADKIQTTRDGDVIEVCLSSDDSVEFEKVDLATHGYVIYNNAGVEIEKFVTALKQAE